jgi:multimeric flavodoxin WrbA
MNVVAINGSPREGGNTSKMLQFALAAIAKEGIDTELVELAGQPLRGCTACGWCFKNPEKRCVIDDDRLNELFAKIDAADGVLLGSPTYFADVTAEMKALIDRVGYVAIANDRCLARKVGAAVAVARRAGAVNVFDSINHLFLIHEMIVPGSVYWNLGLARQIGEVDDDEEAIRTMTRLGENMAWLLKKIG